MYMGSKSYGLIQANDNSRLHLGDINYYGNQERLKHVPSALFNAYGIDHQACHSETRRELLQEIERWTEHSTGTSIFWLNGMAGTGKSTIAYTVAERLNQQTSSGRATLGASFFFKRGEGDRGSAALFIPTVARQLAMKIDNLDVLLAKAVETDPDICCKSLGEQFDKLLRKPLQRLGPGSGRATYVMVVDALDECEKEADIRTVLHLWSSLPQTNCARLRLFLTSRPELVIRLGFKRMSTDLHRDVILHEVPRPIIKHDILAFLKDAFIEIRKEYNLEPADEPLVDDWPGDQTLQVLTDMAVPLFIVAATMYRFIRDGDRPRGRLETVLQSRKSGHLSQMGQVYTSVLQSITTTTVNDKQDKEQQCSEFRHIVGSIVTLAEPLSRTALAALLNLPLENVTLCLRPLHSVLQVPIDKEALVRPLHLSFGEYLTSLELQNEPFGVDVTATHRMLWRRCLQLLLGPHGLRENICSLSYPGQPRHEISPAQVDIHLPPAVRYACRYWVYHIQSSTSQLCDEDEIHIFLQKHFLHWLEALSFLDRLADAIEFVRLLQLNVAVENSICVSAFLEDAQRFVLTNRFIGELAPLQLYSSAITFAPQNSIVKAVCGQIPSWVQQAPITPLTWSLELQKLEGHTRPVRAVAFSPDNSLLASASHDQTVRLWNPTTGQEVQKLEGHTSWVTAVAFSPRDSLLASASQDQTVRLWNLTTGREVYKLKGHTHFIKAVTFSPDGSLLASASYDQTVRLWDLTTAREVQKLEGHTGSVEAVAFSPDGSLLASASDDRTVRLWNLTTGREVQKLEGHTHFVKDVAFSPDGSLLSSASYDQTVWLWDLTTSQEVQKLEGHSNTVEAVVFSPDGSLLASASDDRTVRLWNPATGQEVQKLEGHTNWVTAVAFSPDGSLLASASYDQTVRLWNATTGQGVQKLEGHTSWVTTVAFSPDRSLLASASYDLMVRLWNPTTGRELQKLEGHTHFIKAVTFSPDGSLLASASYDQTVRLWDPTTGREAQKLEGHTGSVEAVAFSPDGSLFASASYDQTVRLWDPATGREVQKLEGHTTWVTAMAFSPDGSLLASASHDRTVRLWNLMTGQETQKLEGHTSSVEAVAFSPDGSLLASASHDQTVRLWNRVTGQEVQKLKGHTSWVKAVAFSSDGSLLASASDDRTVRLWNLMTGQEVQKLNAGSIFKLSFTPDNSTLNTNRGRLRTNTACTLVLPLDYDVDYSVDNELGRGLMLHHDWIEHGSEKLLWLPQEYRSNISALSGNMFAIGCNNGSVTFLRIKYP